MVETKMEFVWPEGEANASEKEMWNSLKETFRESGDEGVCYFRYPVFSIGRRRREPDFLMLHRQWGLYVIECKGCHIDNIERIDGPVWIMQNWHKKKESPYTQAEEQLFPILDKFKWDERLRRGRNAIIAGHVFIALPFITRAEWKSRGFDGLLATPLNIIFADDLSPEKLRNCLANVPVEERQGYLTDDQFRVARGILQGVPVISQELRAEPAEDDTKAAMLLQVENQIQIIDREQQKVAVQIPDGPQRIRGLAGSGKTVVMCMKAAEMHRRHPDWDIVYTFYTRSLSAQVKNLITYFYRYWEPDQEPDWNKVHILHAWGAVDAPGLYSSVSRKMKRSPRSWRSAKSYFTHKEQNEILGKCCEELLTCGEDVPVLFDAILIDEAQDFHFGFYKLCYATLSEPKRLIWAYDEVQSLESLSIPTTIEIFGTHPDGTPVVNLEGSYPGGEIEKDIILRRCYRTPRPILVTAHIFGMGLLRPQGAVQFIPTRGGWEDIGYEIVDGSFQVGQKVTIRRPEENSPHILEKLTGYKDLVQWRVFDTKAQEYDWIAGQVHQNIFQDELKPEEIVVISLDWNGMRHDFPALKARLNQLGVSAMDTRDTDRDVFRQAGSVILTNIFRAKGNEGSVVYVMGFDGLETNSKQIVQDRNQVFTAMTRTRGWCFLSGTGKKAVTYFDEIAKILSEGPERVTFEVPDPKTIQRNLDNLEYEKRRNKMKKAQDYKDKLKQLLAEVNDPGFRKAILEDLQTTDSAGA